MQLQYALYERTPGGYRWTWRAVALGDTLLNEFLFRIDLPTDSNAIRADQLRGGICKFVRRVDDTGQQHVVLYRFFDGGSDAGRPHRVVMLTAWTTPGEIAYALTRCNVTTFLRGQVFEYVAGRSQKVGIEQPAFLDSLVTEEDCDSNRPLGTPLASVTDFVYQGCPDEENDYYLVINDSEAVLSRKRSINGVGKKKEPDITRQPPPVVKGGKSGKQLLPVSSGQAYPGQRVGGSIGPKEGEALKRGPGLAFILPCGAVLVALTLVVAAALLRGVTWDSLVGGERSRYRIEAAEVLRVFGTWTLDQQQEILAQLAREHQQRVWALSNPPPSSAHHWQHPPHVPAGVGPPGVLPEQGGTRVDSGGANMRLSKPPK